MCGITGIIEKKPGFIPNRHTAVKTMTDALRHRGPDAEAFFDNDKCTFGMRRLAILDLAPDLYPFSNNSGSIQLVFNGEIYNYPQLKKELETFGYVFKTHCDGEVIVYGYEKWGTEVFTHLRGMFAIALWDGNNGKTVLARDRLGIKPLYYTDTPDYFAFSSEVKAFIEAAGKGSLPLSLKLDEHQIHNLLGFMFLPESDKTVITGIKKVEPATFMEISEEGIKSTKYWDIGNVVPTAELSYDDAVNRLDELLTESVSLHLLSDVPLGLLLSGGVDSSLIAALMAKKLGVETHTYTAKFNHKFNESSLAADTAEKLGTIHKEFLIDVDDINKNIDDYMGIFDDLTTFDGGIISTSILAKYVRNEGIKVLLLGEGADEVFGGYSWFGLSQMPFSLLPKILRVSIYYYGISRNYSFNYFNYVNYWYKKSLPTVNTFNDIARKELQTQLPNHLLMKVDKATMSASIEARVPYLDHELVEFVYSLPANFKLAGNFYNPKKPNEKRILRDVATRYLPSDVTFRKKKGFLLPMNDVLLSDREKVKSRITDSASLSKRILGANFVDSLFDDSSFSLAKMQKEYFTWRLFILESWAKHYNLQ